MFLHADSEDSDQTERMPRLMCQTGQMPRLMCVFAGRRSYFVGFVMRRLRLYERRDENTCFQGLRPVKTQTGLLSSS